VSGNNSLRSVLSGSHREIEELIESSLRGNIVTEEEIRNIKTKIKFRMYVEEELVFPLFRRFYGLAYWLKELQEQHSRIWRELLSLTEARESPRDSISYLARMLEAHESLEEHSIYNLLDTYIDENNRREVMMRILEVKLPEGWKPKYYKEESYA